MQLPSEGDWALQRSGAITMEGVEGVTIDQNQLTRVDGNGIFLGGYCRGVEITNNDMNWIGDSAMAAFGWTSDCLYANCSVRLPAKVGPDGRGGEQPRGTLVAGNVVREIGIWQKQSSMWFQVRTTTPSPTHTHTLHTHHTHSPHAPPPPSLPPTHPPTHIHAHTDSTSPRHYGCHHDRHNGHNHYH
jgi:hypothetical protein